ncbi:fibronectin type III domain-containing protein 7 [Solea senegalensis]|uniref:Fibronectin type III domain-containing protein 7 n=2 Tax=Solea senegalensis TaxID=28829 RepID=A0AAV6SCG4_SOLSE|nr:fibronectin type III domain-containing protein 7 [Solea senegalensis]
MNLYHLQMQQVKWEKYATATSYFLDLRVKNKTDFAPVVVTLPLTNTEWNVQGLRPGMDYTVTLKVFQYYFVVCKDTAKAGTGPDTSQIKEGKALTSRSVSLKWSDVPSTDYYILTVSSQDTGQTFKLTFPNTNTSAVVENLTPSTHYDFHVYTVNQAGMGHTSKVRTITTLAQPPEIVTAIQTGDFTARVEWSAVTDVLMYKVSIQNIDDPTSTPSEQEIPYTQLDVDNILPCSTYLISVSSLSQFLVPSEPTTHTYSTNKLTPVSSVSVDYTCETNSATIHWSTVVGADSYRAKVTDKNGAQLMCTDQGSSCQITGLNCGQIYTVQVTPVAANCENSMSNITATFHTVHCPPGNLSLVRECSSDAILFSWGHMDDTEYYEAFATDSKGVVIPCTTTEDSCYFTNMACGEHYVFTVSAVTDTCPSQASATVDVRTAPCVPTNLQTSSDCKSDILLSKWDLAEGALSYTVEAFGNQGVNDTYNCSSVSNSCAIEGIKCGEHLTVYVTAFDDECPSPSRLGTVAETGPCTPQNVSAVKECGADAITASWTMTAGAIFYVAIAKDSNGVSHHCNSFDLTCKIKGLECSTNYTVYVIGSNFLCNSSESQMVTLETDACPPSNIHASLDCAANEAHISWYGQPQIHSYTATIEDEDQVLLSCSSSVSNCSIPNLKCGMLYALTVRHHDGICPSIPSAPIIFESVPCGPVNVHANVDCASGGLSIDWDSSKNAEGYLTVVSGSSGQTSHNTSQPMLSVNTLGCGDEYTVTVMSFNRSCISFPTVLPVREAPCAPTNVVAERNCGQSFMEVTWQASLGAKTYTASAVGTTGIVLTCESNKTSCSLVGVMCGQVYNVSVAAVDDNCTGPGSPVVSQTTAPCPPSQLNASVNCSSNSVELTWSSSPNAVSYTGKAVSSDGHNVTCDAGTELSCHMDGLHCGKEYTFTVSASDGYCPSPDSNPVVQKTAPCSVQNVVSSLNCSTNTLTVSWTLESMPVNYSVTAMPTNESATVLRCISQSSSCTLINLECGEQYTVTVQAISYTCEGHSSVPEIVNSVPCIPMSVQGMMECPTHTLHASWDALSPSSAVSFISTLSGAGGFSTSCSTADKSCIFPGLQCAQTYMLCVVAVNDRCNSSKSEMVSATTAPCDPTSVTAAQDCMSGVATVTWGASAGANYYSVLAEANGHVDSCTSTSTSCDLTELQCGEDYTVTVLAGDGKCNSSILAKTNITTAPCAPVIQTHILACASNHAVVTWAEDGDALNVTVVAISTLSHSTSCSSSSVTSCTLEELQCGHTYTVHAVAQGIRCQSQHSTTIEIISAPCTPSNVEHRYICNSGVAIVSWDETMGRQSFYTHAQSGDHMDSCSGQQTNCSLHSLLCGRTYDVEVIAVADHCNSSVPGVTQIETAPCAPTNVSASLLCDFNTAAVSWQHSAGAISYTVTALGGDGDVKQCTTNETSCYLPNMHCAETYTVTVSPFSTCKGDDSSAITFIAGPCPPTNVHVSLQCEGNVGHVTWDAALQAEQYVVTAVDDHAHNCTSTGTSCSLTDLHCGETAIVTVVTIERGCMSNPSLPFTFQSVICPPTNVTGVTSCGNNDITVSWDPSPESGVSYFLHSEENGGATAGHSTMQTSHVMTGLQCGELYTITVTATDSECTSVLSTPIHAETAPCPPTNLNVTTECGTNLGILTWDPSPHAISYIATATGTHGHVVSCTSNTTTCSAKLDCGHEYTAEVFASSGTCNGSAGDTLTFISAPCLPDNVVAHLDCNVNSFAVEWRGSIGYVGYYTAIAIGSDDTRLACNSTTTNCTIENLQCGVIYSIVVTTPTVDCGIIDGSDYMVQSAPCKPDNIMVSLECSTHLTSVTWENSGPNQTQVVTAVNSAGVITTCNSSSSNCTFDDLTCGDIYSISVVGHTNSCSSDPLAVTSLNTAPCVPTNLRVQIDCLTGRATATWNSALGATSYTVYAHGSLGYNTTCNSTGTTCSMTNLACGQDYNFTVVGLHDSCASLVSESVTQSTGPCPHSGLMTTMDCKTHTATVSWTPGSGILYYNASADPSSSAPQQTCSTGGSSCNITSLQCGETYIVSVSGQGQNCPSRAQEWNRITSAPCPPINFRVFSICKSNDIMLMWQSSLGSASYMAVAENAEGSKWSCNTSSTSCQISQLPCGQQYHVYAVGVDDTCFGDKSNVEVFSTAPCVPQNIQHHLDCRDGVLNITWESTGHALQFCTSLSSSQGHITTCVADQHHSVMSNLQCDLMYNVSVMAMDNSCNSSHSPQEQLFTAPCPLSSFLTTTDCSTGVVSVAWNTSVAGVVHTVTAVDKMGYTHNCTGTSSGCDLSPLDCGTEYNITITPSRDGCVGRDSPTQMITTVPCIPKVSDVEIDCLSNSAWLMYEESTGAEDYVSVVTDSQGTVQTFVCNDSSEGVCSLPELKCSQNLTFALMARDHQCSSPPSNAVTSETAPCPPANVETIVSCDNAAVNITWSAVYGAVKYKATLEDMNGQTICCSTEDNSCSITDLACGEFYTLHLMAEGRVCNSSQNEMHITRTVLCIPDNLEASLNCINNVATMTWDYSKGWGLYRVRAVSADGHEDECISFQKECELTGLRCGQLYTATVTVEDQGCKSRPSESVTIKTAPCTPENISSVLDCEANSLVVSWSESAGADSYVATVHDSDGQTTTCQGTTEGGCNVAGIGCGQIYRISVISSDGLCDSPTSPVVELPSVPCEPTHIQAYFDCPSQTAMVAWYESDGALSYVVNAVAASGNVTLDANMTNCKLEGLHCGESYSVSVSAVGHKCSSVAHVTGQLLTEPCIPENITTVYNHGIGQVMWDSAVGADNYSVEGMTAQGLLISCNTSDNNCALYDLQCGQSYNISVTANNHVCQGMTTAPNAADITTEPCPPNNVQTSVDCQTNTGTVTWEANFDAVGFMVQLAGQDGHSLSCYNVDTFCNIEDLHCGVTYYTSVIAIGERLNSSASNTVSLVAAPCVTVHVLADMNCDNNSAVISWNSSDGATSYIMTAVTLEGYRASCETSDLQCQLTELQCGLTYTISLTTICDHCQVESQTAVTFSTRPCQPMYLGVDQQCGTSTANLFWGEAEGVELYMVTATCSMHTLHFNSTNSTCVFPDLLCGETYEFSVTAYVDGCYSETSSTVTIQTGPCQPTDLMVWGTCGNDTVALQWSAAAGASNYMVEAMGDLGYVMIYQTNETTIDVQLPCGQLFSFTVKAQDDRCFSHMSLPAEFKTTPCVPMHVQSIIHCDNSMGMLSWASSDGAETYLAFATEPHGTVHSYTTNTTSVTWNDLDCGKVYTVQVIAMDYNCSSLPSNTTSIRMAPCIPYGLTSSINCSTKVVSLTWNGTEEADLYLVTAETTGGHKVQLSTNDTGTYFSEFQCGQDYYLSVQAVDSECTSQPSQPSLLKSEPCPPTGISSSMNCLSNIALVSWISSADADFYTATITLEDGQSKSCWSTGEPCGISNVLCGKNYTVTVVASNDECNSDPSEPTILQSVPCIPTDMDVTMDCSENEAVVSWSASSGALFYQVMAQSALGDFSACDSTNEMCRLTNLTCGRTYFVQIVAEDNICSSLASPSKEFKSVPCTPAIGNVVLDCVTNFINVAWTSSGGALDYTATARASNGHASTCSSNLTNCEIQNVQCGLIYNVITVASNEQCDSSPSTSLEVESVPCPPANVEAVLNCSTNTAQVEWQASVGADSYIVEAFGMEEHEASCETTSQSCLLPDLMCGYTYNISVRAVNDKCNVSQSAITQLQAVPCVPQMVEAHLNCESGAVAVSWEASKGASSYTTVAQGNGGYASTCNSSEPTCVFSDLLCGLNYSITVSASDETCRSGESSDVDISSLRCVPQHVSAVMICSNDTAVVRWDEEEVMSSYLVQASGPGGHMTTCNSYENSCQLHSLHCGQLYNLTVTALDGQCDNSHAYLDLLSVPCTPTNVQATLQCDSNTVAVTWVQASGAVSYVAVGVTADGSHQTECNSTMTHCDLSDLQCGQTYHVTVFGLDEYCSSVASDVSYVRTAPCTPQNVIVNTECAEGALTISWAPNPDAQYFHALAVSKTGARPYCNSTGTSCTINNLPCGQKYNVTVLSVRDGCESQLSAVVKTCSAPCSPSNATGDLDCVANSANVMWETSEGAHHYLVYAEGSDGHNSSCTSTSSHCEVLDLNCGTRYTFRVTAANAHCHSNQSSIFELVTGPCALTSVSVETQCNSDTILVEWDNTVDTTDYVVTAENQNHTLISCHSSSDSCLLENITCDMQYSVIVSATSDKCSNLRSPPKKIKTAPCVPANVTVEHLCEESGAVVRWGASPVAISYLLTATGEDGHVATCNTPVSNCNLADLHCGQLYDLNITASGDNCTSMPYLSSFQTVPCASSGLTVNIDCQDNSAVLSWNPTAGAVMYYGRAQPTDGDALYCESTTPSCTFEYLECGKIYNFSVEASNSVCNGSCSEPLEAGAVPCPPTSLKVRMQRIEKTYWAMTTWDHVNCSHVEYRADISGLIQNNPQTQMDVFSYWWSRQYFEFPMPCSTAYNLTVRARNSAGVGMPSSALSGVTAPCPPQNVRYSGNSQFAVLTWDASVFATMYTVYSTADGNRTELCNTTGLSCHLTDFNSSATEVTASNDVGESNPNKMITGPVVSRRRRDFRSSLIQANLGQDLEAPNVEIELLSEVSMLVKWTPVDDATEYTLVTLVPYVAQQDNESVKVKTVNVEYSLETDLKSWTTYCFRVAAKNALNQSSYSRPVCKTTGGSK